MILNLSPHHHLAKDKDFEQRVRIRLQQAGIQEHEFPCLVVKPYPEPEYMRLWLREQHGENCTTYLLWQGWVLFQNEADAIAFTLTYSTQNKI